MVNINFVNTGYDEEILKSMVDDPHVDQEELEKALDRSKLVQKEVQYKTKTGKIATRKQWVRAGEADGGKDKQSKDTGSDGGDGKGNGDSKSVAPSESKLASMLNNIYGGEDWGSIKSISTGKSTVTIDGDKKTLPSFKFSLEQGGESVTSYAVLHDNSSNKYYVDEEWDDEPESFDSLEGAVEYATEAWS